MRDSSSTPIAAPSIDDTRERGKVAWFSDDKGFGFITPEKGADDVFVHHKDIKSADRSEFRTLSEGAVVEFTRAPGRNNRTCAVDVVRVPTP